MNKILLILFFLFFAFKGITQDSLSVNYYLKNDLIVYPYKYIKSGYYEMNLNVDSLFPYVQNENGEIEQNQKFVDNKKERKNYLYYSDSLKLQDDFQYYTNGMGSNIPPFLDTVADGKYKMFYNPIPYQDGDTLKFLRNQIAIIYEVKNNLINGESYWFTPFSQRLYKQGKYVNSKKEGNWWMENQKVITIPTNETFTQSYITKCQFKENLRDGREVNITCPADYNSPYNMTAIWDWKYDTLQKYTKYYDSTLLIEGNFHPKEDEWTFWDWKVKPNESGFSLKSSNLYLYEHFFTNKERKEGRGTIIRSKFDIQYLNDSLDYIHYGQSGSRSMAEFLMYGDGFNWNYYFHHICGALNNFYFVRLPNDAQFKYHEGEILCDNYKILVYDNKDYDYSYQHSWNQLTNSDGYEFFYKFYERYYKNGQLFFKFKLDENGNLERENDTIFWESGLPMNIVRFDSIKQEYEQIIYDSLGTIVKHKVYFEDGSLKIDSLNIDTTIITIEKFKIINDLKYKFSNYNNIYEYCIFDVCSKSDSIAIFNQLFNSNKKEINDLKDTTLLIYSLIDTVQSKTTNLFFNPKSLSGKISFSDYHFKTFRFIKDSIYVIEKYIIQDFEITNEYIIPQFEIYTTLEIRRYCLNLYRIRSLLKDYKTADKKSKWNEITLKNKLFTGKIKIDFAENDSINYHNDTLFLKIKDLEYFTSFYFNNTEKTILLNCLNGKIQLISVYTNINKLKIYEKSIKKNNITIEKHFKNGKIIQLIQQKNNLLNGEQITFSETGDTLSYGNYLNGKYLQSKLNGKQNGSNEYGGLTIHNYKNGFLDGETIEYIDNKLVCIKNYSNGIQKGLTTHYDYLNHFTKYVNWSNNEKDCAVIIKDSLNHILESFFYKMLKDKYGYQAFNPDGSTYYASYFYYQLEGNYTVYYPDGSIHKKTKFKNNEIIDTLFIFNTDHTLHKLILPIEKRTKLKIIDFVNNQKVKELTILDSLRGNDVALYIFFNDLNEYSWQLDNDYFRMIKKPAYNDYTTKEDFWHKLELKTHVIEYNNSNISSGNYFQSLDSKEKLKFGKWTYHTSGRDSFYTIDYFKIINISNLYYWDLGNINYQFELRIPKENSVDTIIFYSTELYTQFDKNNQKTIEKYVIDNQPLYNCGDKETYEIKTYYVAYEKDTSMHLVNGWFKNYYPNGVIQSQGLNKNGLPTGVWKYYNDNGSLREIGRYNYGKRDGRWLSGDLSKIAYLGDICLDLDKPENIEYQKQLENQLKIREVFFKNGVEISSSYFEVSK